MKLFHDLKPTHMAVAFDRPEPTFRKTLFKGYQGKRPEMDDALVSQIPKVQDMVRAFGIPIYEAAGYEADDVLGSIAAQIQTLNFKIKTERIDEIIIVTGDRDILQLVDDHVKVFMPIKGLSEGKLFGVQEVIEKMGVTPAQIPDLKALMGDASDNYPGIAGIGPKTAVDLIARYGSVEEMYGKVKGKRKKGKGEEGKRSAISFQLSAGIKEKLLKGEESARMSKDLATIRTDAPVDIEELRSVTTLDTPEAREKLSELHFPSLVKRLGNAKEETQEKREKKSEQLELV